MKRKYYYYVATIQLNIGLLSTKGTLSTTEDDFPLRFLENYLVNKNKTSRKYIIITFYKEITKENYISYNNEEKDNKTEVQRFKD